MQFNINFIQVGGRLINLNKVDYVENVTEDDSDTTVVIYFGETELELTGDDADEVLTRVEQITDATNAAITALNVVASQHTGANT